MILMADDGMYRSERTASGWGPRRKFGPEINVNGSEIGAALSPSGHTLLFSRDTRGKESGEFFVLPATPLEAWPPACPASG
jgi:hypothetical protein